MDLDGREIKPMKICMIGAGGFIGSYLCEQLMWETKHTVIAIDVYNDKIQHLLQPNQPWSDRIEFYRMNIKNDSRVEGLVKMADVVLTLLHFFILHSFFITLIAQIWVLSAIVTDFRAVVA